VLALRGSRRVKASRGEFFDQGFQRAFFVLEELTEELRATEKAAYERLIRLVAHEVNNSVGAVGSLLESCRSYAGQLRGDDRGDYETALAVAADRLRNLSRFVAGFAEVVRLPPPDRRPCDVRRLVEDLLVLLRPSLDEARVRCSLVGPAALPPVVADKNQLEQVLVNVLKNAAEAAGAGGTIEVRLERGERRGNGAGGAASGADVTVLSVRDSGPGIAPEVAARLFTPFYTTKPGGRGLGLTLVQEVLSQHGFAFRLENRAGGGAEFRIEM
jgi:signal transduction histidine kinase